MGWQTRVRATRVSRRPSAERRRPSARSRSQLARSATSDPFTVRAFPVVLRQQAGSPKTPEFPSA